MKSLQKILVIYLKVASMMSHFPAVIVANDTMADTIPLLQDCWPYYKHLKHHEVIWSSN